MKRTISALLATAGLSALVMLAPRAKQHITSLPVVHAQGGCSDATLSGNYAFVYTGFGTRGHTSKGPTNTPGAVVGVLTLDGAGNSSASYTAVFNGSASTTSTPDIGTYSVNSDCTGTTTDTTAGIHFNFAIAGGGAEIFAIQTDQGNTATFDAKKQ
jgi:hypothetical protein